MYKGLEAVKQQKDNALEECCERGNKLPLVVSPLGRPASILFSDFQVTLKLICIHYYG